MVLFLILFSGSHGRNAFSNRVKRPLADRLRPRKLEEVVGQEQVLGEDSPLGRMLFTGRISSFILWGPPGCGKTTIARLIAEHTNLYFEQISAVFRAWPI